MQPFPHPSDATHKFWSRLAKWLQRYSSLKVWTTTRDGRRGTDDGPLVYYKLTLWAFGSGELITEKRWRHRFPYYKSMGVFCCHRNQSFKPICPKTLFNPSPTLMMLHIKFDQHWSTGLRDIQVSSELWQNDRIPEGQGKSSIAPLFQSGAIKKVFIFSGSPRLFKRCRIYNFLTTNFVIYQSIICHQIVTQITNVWYSCLPEK